MWPENRNIPGACNSRRIKRGRAHVADLGGTVILPDIKVPPPKVKGFPLVSSLESARSASPQKLPSIYESSRCATETPYSLKSPSPYSYVKSASPYSHAASEDSYRTAAPRVMRDAGLLAKLVDFEYWAKEALEVDALASRIRDRQAQMPHVCSTAMAFEVLGKLVQVLPQHRHLMLPLLGHLHLGAYYEVDKGGRSIVPDLCESFGNVTKIPRRTSLLGIQDGSDEEDETGDGVEHFDTEKDDQGNSENDSQDDDDEEDAPDGLEHMHSLKKLSLASEAVARCAHKQVRVRSQSTRSTTTVFSLASYHIDEATLRRDLIGLHHDDESLPAKYEDKVPYFRIAKRQLEVLKQKDNQVALMKQIAGNVNGLQSVAYRLLGVTMEFTSGRLHKWFFNMWKQLYNSRIGLIRQMDAVRRLEKFESFDLLKFFAAWHCHVCVVSESRIQREIKEREFEIITLGDHRESLDKRVEQKLQLRDMSEGAAYFYSRCLGDHTKRKEGLISSLKFFSPEALKINMNRLIDRFVGFVCTKSDLTYMICKRQVMSKDLAFIIRKEDVAQNVSEMPCEWILVRWINYLLGVLKRQASDLLDMEASNTVTDSRSAWSVKHARQYSARCKQVRLHNLIDNLGGDLKSGVVLTALFAMLKAVKSRALVFDPGDLWPMDVKHPHERAAAIIHCLNAFAPTVKMKYFLKPADIIQGSTVALTPFLAAIFLHEAPSDESAVCPKTKTINVRRATAWLAQQQHGRLWRQPTVATRATSDSDSESDVGSDDDDDDLSKLAHLFEKLEDASKTLAYDGVVDLCRMLRENESLSDLCSLEPKELLLRWINLQISECEGYQGSSDESEEAQGQSQPMTSFGGALKDGRKLLKVMMHLLPELRNLYLTFDLETQSDEQCVQAVVELGARCVPFLPLDAEDIRTGQDDLIACFVGKLFIFYPNMPPAAGSRLWQYRELFLPLARNAYALQESGDDAHHWDQMHWFCGCMKKQRNAIRKAVQEILTMEQIVEGLHLRVDRFVRKILESRAQEKMSLVKSPKALTPSARYLRAEPLRFDFMECMIEADWSNIEGLGSFESLRDRCRYSVESCIDSLQNEFLRHSMCCRNGEYRLPCSGAMRIYGVCRMRCPCMHLPPDVAEGIFENILQDDLPAWWSSTGAADDEPESLSIRGFLRWVFRIALHRYEMLLKESGRIASDIDIIEALEHFVHKHIDPCCGQPPEENEFLRIVSDQQICSLLTTEHRALKGIFQMYSTELIRESEEETQEPEASSKYFAMKLADFKELLTDSGLVKVSRGSLNDKSINHIFEQILTRQGWTEDGTQVCGSAHDRSSSKNKPQLRHQVKKMQVATFLQLATSLQKNKLQGLPGTLGTKKGSRKNSPQRPNASSEPQKQREEPALSFYEFVDAILVASLYAKPNPLVSPGLRVRSVFQKILVPNLVEHLRKTDAKGSREKHRDALLATLTGRAAAPEKP